MVPILPILLVHPVWCNSDAVDFMVEYLGLVWMVDMVSLAVTLSPQLDIKYGR